jgi:dTDP-4-dehydrorhamnose reductase
VRIVILGSRGQLATDLRPLLSRHEIVPLSHVDIELTDHAAARARLDGERPDVVINTAAFHRVDDCETEFQSAFAVNAIAALNLARWCQTRRVVLVHFSTDFVFAGDQPTPRGESDRTEPISVYGASKLAGEHLVRQACERHFVIRTCGLYGHAGSKGRGGNFVETMLRLGRSGRQLRVVADQIVGPTATADLARKVVQLLATQRYGLYHITNTGECSWYQFACAIFARAGMQVNIIPTTTAEYGARARRPAYSVLRHDGLRALGLDDMRSWREALAEYIRRRPETD